MKHKTYLKNQSRDFKNITEEIGNLRYDALVDFLQLLSQKIQKDGSKDRSRGRVQLATALDNAAAALQESAKEIDIAWRISEPYMYPEDVRKKIRLEFSNKESQREAFQIISRFTQHTEDPTHRLARCLLFETKGSLEKLQENYRIACGDPRDIMVQAEYDRHMIRLRNFNRPYGEETITQEDLEADRNWSSNSPGDDLPF